MLRSLRARLLTAILGVAAVSLLLAGWLFSRVIVIRFQEFESAIQTKETLPPIDVEPLQRHYRERGDWTGVESVLSRMQAQHSRRLILARADRTVAAVSAPELREAAVQIAADGTIDIESSGPRAERLRLKGAPPIPLRDGAREIGALYTLPVEPNGSLETTPRAANFSPAVNQGLLAVIALVMAMAAVVGLWLARRIVQPVEALRAAVEKMRAGELRQNVPADARDEVGELGRAFNAMAENLARVERLRRDMVSDVAHELRTPLTNIRAQIEAIQDGLSQPKPEVIASLHEEALHLARLVDDLHDLSLGDAGQLRIERERVAPAEAMDQAIAALQARAAERGVSIERKYNGTLPEIFADPVRLGQILRNLLENAIRYTPAGGAIVLEAHAAGSCVKFSVRDSGPGIAAEHLPHIFERFYRTDPSRTRETGGAGLGLAIVRQLVTAHGGSVAVESEPGRGATFHFSLPLRA